MLVGRAFTFNSLNMDFTGKSVLVTGGSRGIGRATAIAFAAKGANVAVNFKSDKKSAFETVELLKGEDHFAIKADIAKPDEAKKLVDTVAKEFGRLDILINNAAVYTDHSIDKVTYEEWQKAWSEIIQTNLVACANLMFCASQHMIQQGGGRIVNVSSRGAFRGEPEYPAYGAAKAGLNALGQSLAQKLAPYNIFIGTVAPGFVETDMAQQLLLSEKGEAIKNQSPLGRVATPEEVAYCILFLASEQAAFTTGCILDVNGASYLRT